MNTTKKVMAILLVLVMVAAFSVSAFAAEIDASNVKAGETYTAYKILEYTSDTSKDPAIDSYYLNKGSEDLKDALEDAGFVFETSADGSRYTVTNADALSAEDIVDALKDIENLDSLALFSDEKTASADGEAVWTELDPGYYFITTTSGSLCTLKTYDDQALILDKQEDSVVEKTVDKTSTFVGDTLTFTVTVEAKKGATVTLTDELSTGLTLNGTAPTVAPGTGYEVTTWDTTPSASSYEIAFDAVDADTTFVVTYTATVNSDALTEDDVNNTATITWGHQTDTDSTTTPLYGFEIQKEDESGTALEGVKFTLKNGDKNYDGETVWTTSKTELETDEDGKISVQGIAAGTYVLTETETLDGYNLLKEDVIITVADDGTVTVSNDEEVAVAEDGVVTVVNTSGSILPDTGTTVFYILGSILVSGAGVVLVSKRRMTE